MKKKPNLNFDKPKQDAKAEKDFLDSREFRRLSIEYCVAIFELTTGIPPKDSNEFRKAIRKDMVDKLRLKRSKKIQG